MPNKKSCYGQKIQIAIQYVIENGATMLSVPHDFFKDLRARWVQEFDWNLIQIVCKRQI
ncbi:hypothetical protein [Niallia hominis]|uniref:Transposase n=1 Tax=Niallia hominis TaxID=3133173 RepID=A0ABV1F570_9BACI